MALHFFDADQFPGPHTAISELLKRHVSSCLYPNNNNNIGSPRHVWITRARLSRRARDLRTYGTNTCTCIRRKVHLTLNRAAALAKVASRATYSLQAAWSCPDEDLEAQL